jgi:hypothetical protein
MKCGARVALGVAGGYFLGRTKKMKLGLMLGSIAAGRRAGGPGELLGQATKLLSASPELTRLTDEVKGRLLDAGKGAALAVAARQVEALTDRVGKRVESIGDVGKGSAKRGSKARSREDNTGDDKTDAKTDAEYDEYEASDTGADVEDDVEQAPEPAQATVGEDEDRPSPRRTTRQNRSSTGRADGARRTATRASAGAAKTGRPTRTRRSNNG